MTPLATGRPEDDDGSTSLGPEDFVELIPEWVNTRADLNRAESEGILSTRIRHFSNSLQPNNVLDDLFLKKLHRDMFGSVWTWAGAYRTRELNLGIHYFQIATAVRSLLASTEYRISMGHDLNLVTCELHHQLVAIHPFVNGNGRHGRLYVDLLRDSLGLKPFNWGSIESESAEETRSAYIRALRIADKGNLEALLTFVLDTSEGT